MNPGITADRTQSRYFVSLGPHVILVHIVGPASYLNCRALGRFLDLQSQRTPRRKLYFNLAACVSLDSTVAGLIAKSAFESADGHAWGRIGIVKAQPRVQIVLMNLGLGNIADFHDDIPSGTGANMEALSRFVETTGACASDEIFQAHEALIALDESNVERFGDVILALREDPGAAAPKPVDKPIATPPPMLPPTGTERGRIKFDTRAPFGKSRSPF